MDQTNQNSHNSGYNVHEEAQVHPEEERIQEEVYFEPLEWPTTDYVYNLPISKSEMMKMREIKASSYDGGHQLEEEKLLSIEWEKKEGIYSKYICKKNESLNDSFRIKFGSEKKTKSIKDCSVEEAIKHAKDYNAFEYHNTTRTAWLWENLDEKMYEYCREDLNKSKNTSKKWDTYIRKNFKK